MKILSGTSNLRLSKEISKKLKLKLVNTNIKRFADGEIFVEINENTLTATDMKGGDWPANGYSRISFDYSKNFPEVMYAQVSGSDQQSIEGLYKTSNGGETWTQITTPSWMDFTYSWYCFKMSTVP